MKKVIAPKKWLPLIGSILLMITGLIVLILSIVDIIQGGIKGEPSLSGIGIAYTIAIALFILGIYLGFACIFNDTRALFSKNYLLGIAATTGGVLFIIMARDLSSTIIKILGIAFIVGGALILFKAISFIVLKRKVIAIIFTFILAAVILALGILAIVPSTKGLFGYFVFLALGLFAFVGGIYSLVKAIKAADAREAALANK